MRLLLEKGASVNLQDKEGVSALHWTAANGDLEGARLCLDHSANPNPMEVDGEKLTPLDYAMIGDGQGNPHSEVAMLLEEKGALSVTSIQHAAAIALQTWVRGVRSCCVNMR